MSDSFELSCPAPIGSYDRIVLAHGGGGRLMQRLIQGVFVEAFQRAGVAGTGADSPAAHDGATLETAGRVAVTTDSFTVSPLFFPGGDIGSLAVHGTVNDLLASGAFPRYLTVAFVLEEGLPISDLQRIAQSMAAAAKDAGVRIVSGDTKVVERGKGDGVFITTTGIGDVLARASVDGGRLEAGDALLVTAPVGDHGTVVIAAREGIEMEEQLTSDSAACVEPILALLQSDVDVRFLRDATRGGLATVLCELASGSRVGVRIAEAAVPVRPQVSDTCELLGLDPLYVACEGAFVVAVAGDDAERALELLHATDLGRAAARVGQVIESHPGTVVLETAGADRVLDLLSGEQLPRIC